MVAGIVPEECCVNASDRRQLMENTGAEKYIYERAQKFSLTPVIFNVKFLMFREH